MYKSLNNDKHYSFNANKNGIYKYKYSNHQYGDRITYSSNRSTKSLEIDTNKSQFDSVELSKRVSADINSQYQKILTYIKK